MLEVSGDDILRELSRRTVGNLGLFTDRTFAAAELVHVISGGEATVLHLPETVNLQSDPLSFIFVKSSERLQHQLAAGGETGVSGQPLKDLVEFEHVESFGVHTAKSIA